MRYLNKTVLALILVGLCVVSCEGIDRATRPEVGEVYVIRTRNDAFCMENRYKVTEVKGRQAKLLVYTGTTSTMYASYDFGYILPVFIKDEFNCLPK